MALIFFLSLLPIIIALLYGGATTDQAGIDFSVISVDRLVPYTFGLLFMLGAYICTKLENSKFIFFLIPCALYMVIPLQNFSVFPNNTANSGVENDASLRGSLDDLQTQINSIREAFPTMENLDLALDIDRFPSAFPRIRRDKVSTEASDKIDGFELEDGFCFISGLKGDWDENTYAYVGPGYLDDTDNGNGVWKPGSSDDPDKNATRRWILFARNDAFKTYSGPEAKFPQIFYSCVNHPVKIDLHSAN